MANAKAKTAKANRALPRNWVGAALVGPGELTAARARGKAVFHVWRCPTKRSLYLVTSAGDLSQVPLPREVKSMGWTAFKAIPETGQPRVGFSEADAKRDIAEYGFHLRRIAINVSERVAPPYELSGHRPRTSAA